MKKNALLVFLLTVLTVSGLGLSHTDRASASITSDSPGSGFAADDPCGFVEGTSTPYKGIYMDADGITPDRNQACADASGYFYERDGLLINRDSRIQLKTATATYTVDLVGETSSKSTYQTVVDQTTGRWSGYGYITDATYTGSNRWVWFDWTCLSSGVTCGGSPGAPSSASYRVRTNLDTGVVSGYAWNDDLGFLSFRNLTMELAPHDIHVYVNVLASDTEYTPEQVDLSTAPLADGYDFWRVQVQFWDDTELTFLDESDFVSGTVGMSVATTGQIFLDQIENTGNPARVSGYNPTYGCSDSSSSFCLIDGTDANADGDYDDAGDEPWSMNAFVFSQAPTSDMTGLNTDTDVDLENYTDRMACRWIYRDQWYEVDGDTSASPCPSETGLTKEDVFYDRQFDRNMLGIENLQMMFTFDSDREMSVSTIDGTLESVDLAAGTIYRYTPNYNGDEDGDGIEDGMYLSFKPRFTTTKFVAVYDGQEYTQISTDETKPMQLRTSAYIRPMSSFAADAGVTQLKPRIDVYYQLDVDHTYTSVLGGPSANDKFLLLDTLDPGTAVDCARRTDTLMAGTYSTSYPTVPPMNATMGYGQKNAACQGTAPTGSSTNTVSGPTAEQWVCDGDNGACYYTAYLNIVDRHASADSMTVKGAINSDLNDETIFTDTEQISVLGSTETIKLRNKMYSQIVRYMLGQTASSGSLDGSMNPSGGLLELMDGRLVIAQGDVVVQGSSAFTDKTLVTIGGNVFIDGDITNGRLGVVALRDNGMGGNVYVHPSVTELYANFFLDGGFYSYSGDTTGIGADGEPGWINDEARTETLLNQLYLNGSLVSRNTVNGSEGTVGTDGLTYYEVGDGTLTTSYGVAREHDLNLIRQYRLCYPLLASGLPDTSADPEVCNEGEHLSEYGEDNEDYSPFILEYAPADALPIFRSQNGLFN